MGAHLPGWRSVTDQATVTAVCDINLEAARRRAGELGVDARVYSDWREMLADDVVDAVDIALPHKLHCAALVDAAKAGKDALTEKPLCITLDEAAQIEQAVTEAKTVLACAHNQMYEPAPRMARKWIREGRLGRVFSLRTVDCFHITGRTAQSEWGWRGSAAEAGGGCALDTGYHPTYLLVSIANSEPKQVVSFAANYNQPTLDAEDTAQTMVMFESGAVGTLQTSWGHHVPNGHWQFSAIGEAGQIYGRGNDLYFQPEGGAAEKAEIEPGNGFVGEIKHFVDCIETRSTPEQGLYEGITVLKVILAGYQSQREGRIITL